MPLRFRLWSADRPGCTRLRSVVRRLAPLLGHPAPAGGGQARRLLEPAGKMTLVREAALLGDRRQFLLAAEQLGLGQVNLAVEQELLWRQAQQFAEAAVEVEGAEVDRLGDVHERGAAVELLLHELQRRDEARQLGV